MEDTKRVYPAERKGGRLLRYGLLIISALLVLTGLMGRGGGLSIQPAAQPTPIPTDEVFDETPAQRQITLPSSTWYALQLGAFESEEAAKAQAEQFARRGAAGYVWPDGRYRALAAAYPDREDAQNVRRQLSENHTVDTYLYEIPLPQIQLRVKGMQGQLDILEAAFQYADDLTRGLHSASISLDRQEMSAAEAKENLSAMGQQAANLTLRLRQRFTAPLPQAVSSLITLLDGYHAWLDGLGDESAVQLGVLIKWETLDILYQLKQLYHGFGTT